MLVGREPDQYTYVVDSGIELAVEEAPVLGWLNIEPCFVEPLENFLFHVYRRPLLFRMAIYVECYDHGPLVEMGRDPVVALSSLDGFAEELSLAVVDRGCGEVGSLHPMRDVF